jgi:hypothetical protein
MFGCVGHDETKVLSGSSRFGRLHGKGEEGKGGETFPLKALACESPGARPRKLTP